MGAHKNLWTWTFLHYAFRTSRRWVKTGYVKIQLCWEIESGIVNRYKKEKKKKKEEKKGTKKKGKEEKKGKMGRKKGKRRKRRGRRKRRSTRRGRRKRRWRRKRRSISFTVKKRGKEKKLSQAINMTFIVLTNKSVLVRSHKGIACCIQTDIF